MVITQANQKRIIRYIKKWRNRLLLNTWTIHAEYEDIDDAEDTPQIECLVRVHINEAYLEMVLHIFPKFWNQSELIQERAILHELSHRISEPMRLLAIKKQRPSEKVVTFTNEQFTETITNLLWNSYHG